jgi:alanine racemase
VSRPIQARISVSALRHNYWAAKRVVNRARVLAVVKANGYGHGAERVGRALGAIDGYALVELEAAIALRERQSAAPILLLEGFFDPGELKHIAEAHLATVVHNAEQLRMLELAKPDRMLDVWLKVNTGMNRLGFVPAAARGALERLQKSGVAKSITLMTHFATADGPPGVKEAMRRFDEATRGLAHPKSLANSAAIFGHPDSHADGVRLGIALYGATPFADRTAASLGLKPAMTLASRIIATQELTPGEGVGYGLDFRCERPMRVGVVACGYGDGYPRSAPSGTPVMVNGTRTRLVGRVSMDLITVDLDGLPEAQVGAEVILWGEGLPVDDVAVRAGTIGYELLCAVAPRVPMVEVA